MNYLTKIVMTLGCAVLVLFTSLIATSTTNEMSNGHGERPVEIIFDYDPPCDHYRVDEVKNIYIYDPKKDRKIDPKTG